MVASAVVEIFSELIRREEKAAEEQPVECNTGNEFDGRIGLRVSSIFVILVGSLLGALFPVVAKNNPGLRIPPSLFFWAKYFGSGVIVATAFIHLLVPAHEALDNECLSGPITAYPWVEGIALMTIFGLFFVELMAMRFATFSSFGGDPHSHSHSHGKEIDTKDNATEERAHRIEPHLSHDQDHYDLEADGPDHNGESYASQLVAIFILEFGVVFHSIFIGLTLAVSGEEFTTLYIVLVFHQTFEGLGLGARLATVPWPKSRKLTPYIMAIAYGLATPLAIAVGLGVRTTYPPEGYTTLVVNGVFDSISAGILMYTGLVELMAHEFLFSHELREGPVGRMFLAFGYMLLGAGLMAILGKWA